MDTFLTNTGRHVPVGLRLILAASLGLTLHLTFAQSFCGTDSDVPNLLTEPSHQPLLPRGGGDLIFRIVAHVVRDASGQGGRGLDDINASLCILREDFVSHGVRFNLVDINYIDDDAFYDFTAADIVPMSSLGVSDAINIFFLETDQYNAGYAPITGNWIWIGGQYLGVDLVLSHVISHEMGHCLGLYHTHHGTFSGESGCAELVDMSNCNACGDFVCDTPADPNLDWFGGDVDGGTCTWLSSGVDANGDPYAPDVNNVMSYTHPACQTQLTPDQVGRINDIVANSSLLTACLTTIAQASDVVDLYLRDVEDDTGFDPGYPWGWYFDHSPDIWVRNESDGFLIHEHQDPEYQADDPDYVYVQVRNRACVPSAGAEVLRLYWTKESTSTSWPQNWDGSDPDIGGVIGTLTIPELGPGESTILEFEWQVPNPYIFDNWSTCLLARIEGSVEDPITVYPGQAELDVYHNNNIALRNTTVVDIVPGMQPTVIDGVKYPPGVFTYVGNAGPTNLVSDLRFDAVQAGLVRTVVDEAEVHVVFDTEGWAKVSPQLGQATGVKQINEGELVLTSAHAVIPDVLWTARTTFPVYVGYNFLCEEVTEPRTYVLHMSQNITGDPEHLLGAEHFTVRWSPRQLFIADGGQNMELRGEPTATLTASSIAEDALYNWYDATGALVASGPSVSVSPMITTKYKLEIVSDLDGFKDYDEVDVMVKDAWVLSVHPNPAQGPVTVGYHLDSGAAGYLTLTRIGDSNIHNFMLNSLASSVTLIWPICRLVSTRAT